MAKCRRFWIRSRIEIERSFCSEISREIASHDGNLAASQ